MEKIKRKGALSEFARYVSLNVAGMIGLSCYILADTFFVAAGLGTNGLTALNLAIPVYSFIHGSGLVIGMGGGTKYSILRSRGNGSGANRAFINSLYIAAALAAVFILPQKFQKVNSRAGEFCSLLCRFYPRINDLSIVYRHKIKTVLEMGHPFKKYL